MTAIDFMILIVLFLIGTLGGLLLLSEIALRMDDRGYRDHKHDEWLSEDEEW